MYYSPVFPLRGRGSPAKAQLHKASPAGNPEVAKAPSIFSFRALRDKKSRISRAVLCDRAGLRIRHFSSESWDQHYRRCAAPHRRRSRHYRLAHQRLLRPRAQHLRSEENVERQIAIVVGVAVEEAAFLLAVQRKSGWYISRMIWSGATLLRLEEHLHPYLVDALFPKRDLLARQRFLQLLPPPRMPKTESLRSCS
jgi:hypothetical protein